MNNKCIGTALERCVACDRSSRALVEQFREPNTPFLAAAVIGAFFGFDAQQLAERAGVHRNTPTVRPHAPRLQAYLRALVRVLAVATELTGDPKRAALLVRNEPLGSSVAAVRTLAVSFFTLLPASASSKS